MKETLEDGIPTSPNICTRQMNPCANAASMRLGRRVKTCCFQCESTRSICSEDVRKSFSIAPAPNCFEKKSYCWRRYHNRFSPWARRS